MLSVVSHFRMVQLVNFYTMWWDSSISFLLFLWHYIHTVCLDIHISYASLVDNSTLGIHCNPYLKSKFEKNKKKQHNWLHSFIFSLDHYCYVTIDFNFAKAIFAKSSRFHLSKMSLNNIQQYKIVKVPIR